MLRKAPGCALAAWSHRCSATGGLRRFIDISAVKLEAAAAEAPKVTSSHYCSALGASPVSCCTHAHCAIQLIENGQHGRRERVCRGAIAARVRDFCMRQRSQRIIVDRRTRAHATVALRMRRSERSERSFSIP